MSVVVKVSEKNITLLNNGNVIFVGNELVTDFSNPVYSSIEIPTNAVSAIWGIENDLEWLEKNAVSRDYNSL